jgi:hypothetical protein
MTAWALKISVLAILLLQGAIPGDDLSSLGLRGKESAEDSRSNGGASEHMPGGHGSAALKPQTPEGTAPQCDNLTSTPAAHRCACGRAMQKCTSPVDPPAPVAMDKKCKTCCREQQCFCVGTKCGG